MVGVSPPQTGLSVSTDALTSLASFCSWQSSHFSSSSSSFPGQPDVSLLVTRANICEGFGAACGTLGEFISSVDTVEGKLEYIIQI